MTAFDQRSAQCRCEWGVNGLGELAIADVIIVVDVLSFSTCVDIAVGRNVAIIPYAWKDASAKAFAREHGAELAGRRGEDRFSLSPASFLEAPAGLRCVLPSPNGAALTLPRLSPRRLCWRVASETRAPLPPRPRSGEVHSTYVRRGSDGRTDRCGRQSRIGLRPERFCAACQVQSLPKRQLRLLPSTVLGTKSRKSSPFPVPAAN